MKKAGKVLVNRKVWQVRGKGKGQAGSKGSRLEQPVGMAWNQGMLYTMNHGLGETRSHGCDSRRGIGIIGNKGEVNSWEEEPNHGIM